MDAKRYKRFQKKTDKCLVSSKPSMKTATKRDRQKRALLKKNSQKSAYLRVFVCHSRIFKVARLAFSLMRGSYSHRLRLQSTFYILLIRPGLSTVNLRANERNNSRKCWELLAKNAAFVYTGLKV